MWPKQQPAQALHEKQTEREAGKTKRGGTKFTVIHKIGGKTSQLYLLCNEPLNNRPDQSVGSTEA
jgi:hypothetical protein